MLLSALPVESDWPTELACPTISDPPTELELPIVSVLPADHMEEAPSLLEVVSVEPVALLVPKLVDSCVPLL